MTDALYSEKKSVLLRPVLQIGHIMATLSVFFTVFAWKSDIDTQTKVNQYRIVDVQIALREGRAATDQAFKGLEEHLVRIEDKLDKKMDKN